MALLPTNNIIAEDSVRFCLAVPFCYTRDMQEKYYILKRLEVATLYVIIISRAGYTFRSYLLFSLRRIPLTFEHLIIFSDSRKVDK